MFENVPNLLFWMAEEIWYAQYLSFLDGKHVFELHGFQPCVLTFLEVVLSLQTSHFYGILGELIGRQSYLQFLQLGISLLHHVTLVVLS